MTVDEAKKILLAANLNPLVREALNVLLPDLLDYYNLPGEIWRDIKGFEGYYHISYLGRVKSFRLGKVKILKPAWSGDYLFIYLYKNGQIKKYFIHILVAENFLVKPEGKTQINHRDGNKQNNCVWNLEWVTPSENIKHAYKIGLIKARSDCEHPNSVLLPEQIREIRCNCIPRNPKLGFRAFAKKFNVSASTIRNVYHHISYKNIE